MFSVKQKREIAEKVQQLLRDTNHPELPEDEIRFHLHVEGDQPWSWSDIYNNGAVTNPVPNPWNEHYENPYHAFDISGTVTQRTACGAGTGIASEIHPDRNGSPGSASRG
jgi:hypothetical protein